MTYGPLLRVRRDLVLVIVIRHNNRYFIIIMPPRAARSEEPGQLRRLRISPAAYPPRPVRSEEPDGQLRGLLIYLLYCDRVRSDRKKLACFRL